MVVFTLFACLPEGTLSTKGLSDRGVDFQSCQLNRELQFFVSRYIIFRAFSLKLPCRAVHCFVLRNGTQVLILQAFKGETEVICSISFKAVCLHAGKWDIIEPRHIQPLHIFESNVSPFFAAVTNATPSF